MSRGGGYFDKKAHRQSEHPEDPRAWGAKCDVCPLRGSKMVWGDGPKDAEMAFIGECPTKEEAAIGLPLCSRGGELLEARLGILKVPRSSVWVDNAVMCVPAGGDLKAFLQKSNKETKAAGGEVHSPVDCCRPRLMRALKVPRCSCGKFIRGDDACSCDVPKPLIVKGAGSMVSITVPLGNVALEAVTGLTGITARRGYVHPMVQKRTERAAKANTRK